MFIRRYYEEKNRPGDSAKSTYEPWQKSSYGVIKKIFALGDRMRQNGSMTYADYIEFRGLQMGRFYIFKRPTFVRVKMFCHKMIILQAERRFCIPVNFGTEADTPFVYEIQPIDEAVIDFTDLDLNQGPGSHLFSLFF